MTIGQTGDVIFQLAQSFGRRGLGKYKAAFRENGIDETVLPNLTAVASARWGTDAAAFSVATCAHQRRRRP